MRRPRRDLSWFAALTLFAASAHHALAAQFDVTSSADSGTGSLRQALLDAAAAAGDDVVVVQSGLGTIAATSELLWSAGPAPNAVTIQGNGVHVDFGGASRGFVDGAGKGVTITDMTITGVGGTATNDAAPVLSEGGAIVLDHCTITGNTVTTTGGDIGGGVLSEGGPVTISNCTISGNTATGSADGGGGVLSEGGSLTVTDSTITGNVLVADGDAGGGLESEGGAVSVTGSTVSCNQATGNGNTAGGLLSEGGAVTIDTSTFAGNVGALGAGALAIVGNGIVSDGPDAVVTNSTVTDDRASCAVATESYFLPKRIKAKANAAHPEKSTLIAAGFFDTGPAAVDLTQRRRSPSAASRSTSRASRGRGRRSRSPPTGRRSRSRPTRAGRRARSSS